MNRGMLMALLAGDILLIGSSAFFLWNRIQNDLASNRPALSPERNVIEKAPAPAPTVPVPVASPIKGPAPVSTVKSKPASPVAAEPARNILFRYRDSVPKRVELIGDFNHWNPQLMRKDSRNNWTLRLALNPGAYSYNFIVDGRIIRDPSNRKTKKAGQKILSSLLTVKPGKAAGKLSHKKPAPAAGQ